MKNINYLNLILLGLLILLTGLVAGCNKSEEGNETVISVEEVGNPNASIKLKAIIGYWNTLANPNEPVQNFYQERLEAWAEKNPDVFLEVQIIPGGQVNQVMGKLLTSATAGNAPDFSNIDSFWVGNFLEADVLQPIDAYLSADEQNQFFDFTKVVTNKNGKQYALWAETNSVLYYYNKKYIANPPQTWDQLFEISKDIRSNYKNVSPFLTTGKDESAVFQFLPYFWAQGGKLFDTNNNYKPIFGIGQDKEALVNVLQFYKKLIETKTTSPSIAGYSHDQIQAEAIADTVASFVNGSWIYSRLLNNIEDAEKNWAYTSLPQESADQRGNISGGWTFAFFTEDEKKLKASIDFVKEVYINPESMAERMVVQGYIPTRKDVFDFAQFAEDLFFQSLYKELSYSNARPASSLYPTVSTYIQELLGKIITGANINLEEEVDNIYKKTLNTWENNN